MPNIKVIYVLQLLQHINEPSGPIEAWEFRDQMTDCQLLYSIFKPSTNQIIDIT
jgi:hypothetical protein